VNHPKILCSLSLAFAFLYFTLFYILIYFTIYASKLILSQHSSHYSAVASSLIHLKRKKRKLVDCNLQICGIFYIYILKWDFFFVSFLIYSGKCYAVGRAKKRKNDSIKVSPEALPAHRT
jgi:hypothetical protein